MTNEVSSLLLELGVPFKVGSQGLLVEAQALNGMRLWSQHFDRVTICAPQIPLDYADTSTTVWSDPSGLLATGRVILEPLPWGYHPRDHFKYRSNVLNKFNVLVPSHRYLCFSNIGAFGAWGNLGVASARRLNRPYSLWFDWVLHKMTHGHERSLKKRVRDKVYRALTKRSTYLAVRHCSLGLFHGQTVYDAYAPVCRIPAIVHDVHVHPGDAISDANLSARLASLDSRRTLRIGYVGRAHPMKAPLQWIQAIGKAIQRLGGGRLEATWLGDGPLLDASRALVCELGLKNSISFKGFVSDRSEVLAFLQNLDLLIFTHVSPESPRTLIEALVSGVPLVGYDSAYVRELVGTRGGAILCAVGDIDQLASNIVQLAGNLNAIKELTIAAATARAIYNDEAVFSHRARLIKSFL